MNIKGRLFHKFHSPYFSIVVMEVSNAEDASILLEKVNEQVYEKNVASSYVFRDEKHLVRLILSSEETNKFVNWLSQFERLEPSCEHKSCRNKKNVHHKIDAITHSLDVGPVFEINMM